ncbi:hypothetical protein H8356DRAFT_1326358 [Neocallimastix lanati (nom. inval.)]|nr:hypothetical protein H8356DRAFT_1326358 [Neocallimastix sp. JGI-2020a]
MMLVENSQQLNKRLVENSQQLNKRLVENSQQLNKILVENIKQLIEIDNVERIEILINYSINFKTDADELDFDIPIFLNHLLTIHLIKIYSISNINDANIYEQYHDLTVCKINNIEMANLSIIYAKQYYINKNRVISLHYATDLNITLDIKENDFNINNISLINRVNSEIMLKMQFILLINQKCDQRKYLNINTSLFQILLPKINRFYNFYSNYEIRGNNYRQNIFNNYHNDHNLNIKNKLNLIFNANSTENEGDFDSNPNKYNSISYNYRFIKRRLIEIPFKVKQNLNNYLYQEYSEYQVNNSTSYKNGTHKAINDLTSKILNIKYIRITS